MDPSPIAFSPFLPLVCPKKKGQHGMMTNSELQILNSGIEINSDEHVFKIQRGQPPKSIRLDH